MAPFIPLENLTSRDSVAPWLVTRREIVPAPPERVWQALTDPVELGRWWCDSAEIQLSRGGRFAFSGPHVPSVPLRPPRTTAPADSASAPVGERDFEILDFAPAERLEFCWPLGGARTRVKFDLGNHLELTSLRVTQTADLPLDWEPDAGRPDWWWVALPGLRTYVENGTAALRLDYERVKQSGELELAVDVFTFPWIIWRKLVDPAELARWWSEGARVELEPGGTFCLPQSRLAPGDEGPERICALEENRRLVLDWRRTDGSGGQLALTIEDTDLATRVTLRDAGPLDPGLSCAEVAIRRATLLLYLKQISERGVTPLEYQAD